MSGKKLTDMEMLQIIRTRPDQVLDNLTKDQKTALDSLTQELGDSLIEKDELSDQYIMNELMPLCGRLVSHEAIYAEAFLMWAAQHIDHELEPYKAGRKLKFFYEQAPIGTIAIVPEEDVNRVCVFDRQGDNFNIYRGDMPKTKLTEYDNIPIGEGLIHKVSLTQEDERPWTGDYLALAKQIKEEDSLSALMRSPEDAQIVAKESNLTIALSAYIIGTHMAKKRDQEDKE